VGFAQPTTYSATSTIATLIRFTIVLQTMIGRIVRPY
jgi:hypothetical protein